MVAHRPSCRAWALEKLEWERGLPTYQSRGSPSAVADRTGSIVEGTMNQSQRAIMNSIRIEPLSKPELECRRNSGPLPKFNGQPSQWFIFIASYRDSASKCGYSAVENLKRINDALLSPARDTVAHLLERPHKLEKVLSILEHNFGRPETMLSYAEDLARQMCILSDNLANISAFYAEVMNVQDSHEMMDEGSSYASLVEGIIRHKLSQSRPQRSACLVSSWRAFWSKSSSCARTSSMCIRTASHKPQGRARNAYSFRTMFHLLIPPEVMCWAVRRAMR